MARILIADDNDDLRAGIAKALSRGGHIVDGASNGSDAVRMVVDKHYDVVLTDIRMPGLDGMDVLREVRSASPLTDVIVITAYGTVEQAVDAMRFGAYDYMLKPFSATEVDVKVERVLKGQRLRRRTLELEESLRTRFGALIGHSAPMRKVYDCVARAAELDTPALIEGRSGTGKELVAREVHRLGKRVDSPFISIGCVGLPLDQFMRECVGGILGDSDRYRMGKLQEAEGGTVYFDEIGELPHEAQSIIIKLIDEGCLYVGGDGECIPLNVRIIASTHIDLEKQVTEGAFRSDLLNRLRSFIITVPPLIKRADDIPELVEFFLAKYNREFVKGIYMSPEVVGLLKNYPWPGNVRELENVISQAVILTKGPEMTPHELPGHIVGHFHEVEHASGRHGASMVSQIKSMEREAIVHALKENGWNQLRTAEALDMNRSTLQYKMKKYAIKMQRRRRARAT